MKLVTATLCLVLLISTEQAPLLTLAFGYNSNLMLRSPFHHFTSFSARTAVFASTRRRSVGTTSSVLFSSSSSFIANSNTGSSNKKHGIWSHQKPRIHHILASSLMSTRGGTTSATTTTALNSVVVAAQDAPPAETFRSEYQPLVYLVSNISMDFVIRDRKTTVTSEMTIRPNNRNTSSSNPNDDMVLDGDETCVKLLRVALNGRDLIPGTEFTLAPGKLIIKAAALHILSPSDKTVLTTVVEIVPEDNTQLSGLYKSGPMYCSQCEAMGFRRITYYPDRPDNMAVFDRVRVEAATKEYPILLSNGNLLEQGTVMMNNNDNEDRHYAIWSDPFPKPSYLFCVVAGNLGSIQDSYTTTSGRDVKLEIFSEPENVGKLAYAMESLKRSMKWDEDTFGLEYDLGIYNIVAVNDFNMGAMENKGLNVFNTAYVLADPATATDGDYERVEGVIGHEYFHNWTGNRVTCRDWFQLTLKEGLTVFRDQQFSGDMGSNAVKRIEDVRALRGRQFNEDAGPMSHPIRPESYISMDNFYTSTVYSKGAEVIRMYRTLLSEAGFRKGMDLYFQRHDGDAVTCDDFRAAMADANEVNLDQFGLWYSTNGTPTVTYSSTFKSGTFSLTLSQRSNSVSPMHIPVSVGLIDKETGKEVLATQVLELREDEQTFTFDNLQGDVVPSILRDFSAPVKLVPASGVEDETALAFLAAYDTDGFNKWEAGQKLYTSAILQSMDMSLSDATAEFVYEAFGNTLVDKETTDYSIQAYALTLPSESTLAEQVDVVDPVAIRKARGSVKKAIARKFQEQLKQRYDELTAAMEAEGGVFKVDATAVGRRRIRNVLLEYLCSIKETPEEQLAAAALATAHFENASGMTDKMAAFGALASMHGEGAAARDAAVQKFYDDAKGDALVLNKWFTVQAVADLPDVLDRVKKLTEHPDFTLSNPNRCRSLVSAFTMNAAPFHAQDGAGYEFLGTIVADLDKLNPQISSRTAGSLIQWRRYDEKRGALMKAQLERLAAMSPISDDLFEVVTRGLK